MAVCFIERSVLDLAGERDMPPAADRRQTAKSQAHIHTYIQ